MEDRGDAKQQELVGLQVGNYVIQELIGEGGMGEVYLAEHPEIGRKVAFKVLGAHLLQSQMAADRFISEAKLLTRLDHPNIISIFDFGHLDDGRLYYVMEYLKGVPLSDIMEAKGKLSPAEVAPYVVQICEGLHAAHEGGVIHRDLKPENIFVLDRKTLALKILDFGIAKLLEPTKTGAGMTATGMVMGSPLTMAPEQAAGTPDKISTRTDLYSLGVVLYWMLSGLPPFSGEGSGIVLAKHIVEEPEPLESKEPAIPGPVADVVRRCMAKNPQKRQATALEVAREFLAATGVGADPQSLAAYSINPVASATSFPPSARATTLRGANGEIDAERVPTRSRSKVLVAAGLLAVGLAVTAVVLLRGGSRPAVTTGAAVHSAASAGKPDNSVALPVAPSGPSKVAAPPEQVKIQLTLRPTGARVLLDGTPQPANPLVLEKSTTPRTLRIEAAGHRPLEQELSATHDQSLTVELEPEPAAAPRTDGKPGHRHGRPRPAKHGAADKARPRKADDPNRFDQL